MAIPQVQVSDSDPRPKWFSSPVAFHKGSLADVRAHIPDFERRSFSLEQPGGERTCLNARFDTIVRRPFQGDGNFIPVGVVSKDYTLAPHKSALNIVERSLASVSVDPDDVQAEIEITEYGERIHLSLYLPEKFIFDPGDGHPMALRLECFNSVDGSTRFRALMGWFRFVCSNGLVIGVTRSDLRRRHVGEPHIEEVEKVLSRGLEEAETEKGNFERWRKVPITFDKLVPWIDKDLKAGWGFKAAARAYHIACFGSDAEVVGPYKGNEPTTIPMESVKRVPGTPERCDNLFDLSQILVWLAKERRDEQEQLEWREKIPSLMAPLLN
jgi:hypothetical protein